MKFVTPSGTVAIAVPRNPRVRRTSGVSFAPHYSYFFLFTKPGGLTYLTLTASLKDGHSYIYYYALDYDPVVDPPMSPAHYWIQQCSRVFFNVEPGPFQGGIAYNFAVRPLLLDKVLIP